VDDEVERLRREEWELTTQFAADPYEKLEELGVGGFCTVTRATRCVDDGHYIDVCLKELKPKLREDPDSVRYFRREARIASNLRHGNIVRLIDVDFPRHRLVYELVDGVDLRHVLAQAGGKLNTDLVILIGVEIASALDYAHSRTRDDMPAGVIHRDLKPANVLISEEGEVVLADFGAAAIESSDPQTSVRGTAAYMSPEQSRGRPVDARTDLFSLGVMLYELVAGRRPFDGDREGPASFERLHRGEYPSLASIVPRPCDELVAIIDRLLRPNRDDRYRGAFDVVVALSAIAPGREVVRLLGALSRAGRRRQTKPYDKLQAARELRMQLSAAVERPPAQLDDALTLLYSTVPPDTTPVEVASRSQWSATPRMLLAVLGGVMAGTLYLAQPASPDRSPNAAGAFRGVDVPARAGATDVPAANATMSEIAQPRPTVPDVHVVPDGPRSDKGAIVAEATSPIVPAENQAASEAASNKVRLSVGADMSAPVSVDGHSIGWSPAETKVEPGLHTIVIGKGERQKTLKMMVIGGRPNTVFVNVRQANNEQLAPDGR
jgi:serine/threonine-protein kinase